MSKLEKLKAQYNQAVQNFNYADEKHIKKAILELQSAIANLNEYMKNERKCG